MKETIENIKNIQQEILNANSKFEDILSSLNDSICSEQGADDVIYMSDDKSVTIYKDSNEVSFIKKDTTSGLDDFEFEIKNVKNKGKEEIVTNLSELGLFVDLDKLQKQINTVIELEKDLLELSYYVY